MTNLMIATAVLAAALTADSVPSPKKPTPAPKTPAAPTKSVEQTPALKDAVGALMGPCSADQATGRVTSVEVLDGSALNALREREKSTKPKADPSQRFVSVKFVDQGTPGQAVRQVTTHFMLTTEQAQALIGERICIYGE